jgi:hypothetical protein
VNEKQFRRDSCVRHNFQVSLNASDISAGAQELRPAVKELYQLRPKMSASHYQLRPKMSASCVSLASQDVCFMRISCVPRCLLHAYQLRPNMSASRVSVASQDVCFMRISCVPRCQPQANELHRKKRSERIVSNNLKVLTQLYCTLLYRQFCAQVQNC